MSLTWSMIVAFSIAVAIIIVLSISTRSNTTLPTPPGPPKLPIIGSVFHAPKDYEWLTLQDWSRQYNSDILYFEAFGSPIVIVNSRNIADDLLEKRSAIYSDRPAFPMFNELVGFSYLFAFMHYGKQWKEHRRLFHQEFSPPAASRHLDDELRFARVLLNQLLDDPDSIWSHLRHLTAGLLLKMSYGITIKPENDEYITLLEDGIRIFHYAAKPWSYLVNSLPFLKHVPDWIPGAAFKTQAKEWRKSVLAIADFPFAFLKSSVAHGTGVESIGKKLLESLTESDLSAEETSEKEGLIKRILAAGYAGSVSSTGGSDTMVTALSTFFLAMIKYPEVQQKARACVDSLVGGAGSRLPNFSDRGNSSQQRQVHYIEAVVREVLRWQPVTPLVVPHRLVQEDVYKGYRIPAGSTVIANAWAMLYDEATYGHPHIFDPERYLKDGLLDPDVPDPTHVTFGFGRRACPGMEIATSLMWITIVSVLASFDIEKAVGEDGAEIDPPLDYDNGTVRHLKPFAYSIKPRSKSIVTLIRAEPTMSVG